MAGQRRAKMDLDRARRAKQQAKRERRLEKGEGGVDDVDGVAGDGARPSGEELLAQLSDLHERFAAGVIEFEEFEATKQELIDHLTEQ